MTKRVYRSNRDRVIAGVCGGVGHYLDVDPVLVRLIWVVMSFLLVGTGILAYLLAWILIPREPETNPLATS